MNNRIEIAVEMLKEGRSFKLGDILLSASEDVMHVTSQTRSFSLDTMSQASALRELSEIKGLFEKMISKSSNLSEFAANKSLEFILTISAGMSNQPVCREHNGEVIWESALK